jgi:hypothetical protein
MSATNVNGHVFSRNSGDVADLYTRPPSKISNNPFETKRAGYRSNPNIFVHKATEN